MFLKADLENLTNLHVDEDMRWYMKVSFIYFFLNEKVQHLNYKINSMIIIKLRFTSSREETDKYIYVSALVWTF